MNKHPLATTIEVLVKSELTESYYRRLWVSVNNVDIPRRGWLDELADHIYGFRGQVVYPSGKRFGIPCIDEVFGEDSDVRWMGYYLQANPSGLVPLRISRKFERIQLLDLYFRIAHPNIARHFGR